MPPGPTSVTIRQDGSASIAPIRARSSSLPMKRVDCDGTVLTNGGGVMFIAPLY
jgi:hypothetical protein